MGMTGVIRVLNSSISQRLYTDFLAGANFFFEHIELHMNVHTGFFIQPQRTGQVFSVHAQADLVFSTPVELAEGMLQKCQAKTAFAPGAAHAQHTDMAYIRVFIGMRTTQADTCYLVSIPGDEPQ